MRIQISYPDTRLNKARPLRFIPSSLDERCDVSKTGGFLPANLTQRLLLNNHMTLTNYALPEDKPHHKPAQHSQVWFNEN
ncbi:hypothetical protein [Enterobacter hormaechei]